MTRSKCQNRELAIATVVTRNDLYSTWEEKMANSLWKGGDGREQFTGIKQLLYSPNFQDFSFPKSLGVPNNDQRFVKR